MKISTLLDSAFLACCACANPAPDPTAGTTAGKCVCLRLRMPTSEPRSRGIMWD
ncbi:uncharacterized protein MYCGRDRAFT_84191 [Zymoseptoria tritici IPO323]|uniref:Uncharacterized protein n=1 Tax=Zymoseptoria tritici (strain CBS 115943 / IPO323) TaxID=336722 RepID=F9X0N5_ZYMTI|nr:uncharacterized protein MYCGRDRAFT_84191 [Zymoseptoria tritici IPO323]EGP91658.1 hypothetical protein MYCGRDRAFT_84191 [Zymoseptoria tritici IPO323]